MLCFRKLNSRSCLFLLIGMCLVPCVAQAQGYSFVTPGMELPPAEVESRVFPPQIVALPDVTAKLRVARRCSQLMVTRHPISHTFVADPRVVDIVDFGPNEVSFVGLEQGATTVTLWFGEAEEPLILQVEVTPSIGVARPVKNQDVANRGVHRPDRPGVSATFGPTAGHAPSFAESSRLGASRLPAATTATRPGRSPNGAMPARRFRPYLSRTARPRGRPTIGDNPPRQTAAKPL